MRAKLRLGSRVWVCCDPLSSGRQGVAQAGEVVGETRQSWVVKLDRGWEHVFPKKSGLPSGRVLERKRANEIGASAELIGDDEDADAWRWARENRNRVARLVESMEDHRLLAMTREYFPELIRE